MEEVGEVLAAVGSNPALSSSDFLIIPSASEPAP